MYIHQLFNIISNSSWTGWDGTNWQSNLTFQVTCDWQLSQFLWCFLLHLFFQLLLLLSLCIQTPAHLIVDIWESMIFIWNFFFKFLLWNAFSLSSSSTIILLEQESGPSPLLGWKRGRLEETRVGGKKLETKSSLSRSSDHGSHQFLPFANHPGFLLWLSEKTRNELCVSLLLSREFFANFFEVAPPILPECPHAKGLRPQRNNAFDLRLCF